MDYQVFIPARKGSKRFPGKNLMKLGDIPLITHSIIYALKFFSNDHIWVNSDDDNILAEAKRMGVQAVKRPSELGEDFIPTSDVSEFQLHEFERLGVRCDAMILLQATNPLRPSGLLEQAIEIFNICDRGSLATFTPLNKKTGVIKDKFFYPQNYIPGQRMQDKEPDCFENGLLYITKAESIKKKTIITNDVYPLVINDIFSHIDIDEPDDLLFAEFVLSKS